MQSFAYTSLSTRKDQSETAQHRSCLSTESFCFSRTLSRGWGSDTLVPIPSWVVDNNFLVTQFTPSVLNKNGFYHAIYRLIVFYPYQEMGYLFLSFSFILFWFLDNATTTKWWTNKSDLQRKPVFYKLFQLFLTVTNRNWSEDGILLIIIKVAFVAVVDHIANINTMIKMKRVSAFQRASTRLTKL